MHLRPVELSAVAAVLLVTGCFNPGDADVLDTDAAATDTADETGAGAPDGNETEPEPDPTGSDEPGGESTTADGDVGSCGDGVVQGGEECDLGEDNSDDGACTESCTIAICGDGYVHQGAEVCDDGEASPSCDADCTVPECGDGVTNPMAFEQCDGDDEVLNGHCEACVAVCDPGWSRCGGGPVSPCDSVIDSQASCVACGHEWRDEIVWASEQANIDSQWGPSAAVAFVQAARWDASTVTGWVGFDLDAVAPPIFLAEARLEVHVMMNEMGPITDVVIDPADGWSPADLSPGAVLFADFVPFDHGLQAMDLDLEAWDWPASVQSGWLNLGFVPRGPMSSSLELEGTYNTDMAPRLRIQGCF